jgi:hypothetical protein
MERGRNRVKANAHVDLESLQGGLPFKELQRNIRACSSIAEQREFDGPCPDRPAAYIASCWVPPAKVL